MYSALGRGLGGVSRVRYLPTTTADGGAVLDPDRLVAAVVEAIDGVRVDRPLAAVGLTTFWHSLLGVGADGRPVTPLLLWMDGRSGPDARLLRATLDPVALHARTGCPVHSSYWPAKLHWLRRTQPATFGAAARWISFGDYLAERLSGRPAGTSLSMASATGLYDQQAGRWDPELIEALGLRLEQLPTIVSLDEGPRNLATQFAGRWPALRGVPWLPAIGDGAASNVGAGCLVAERIAVMVGTSAAVRAAWRGPAPGVAPDIWNYCLDASRPVIGGAINDGGVLLDWLRRTLRLPARPALEAAVAAMTPAGHGLTLLPYFAGERSPVWRTDARGALLGARIDSTPTEIYRAALEAIALLVGRIVTAVDSALPTPSGSVVATGGALLGSATFRQIMADVLGRPVLRSAVPEGSSRGVALVAAETFGLLQTPLEALPPPIASVVEPNPANRAIYQEALTRLIEAERAVVPER